MILEYLAPWWAMPLWGFGVYAVTRFAVARLLRAREERHASPVARRSSRSLTDRLEEDGAGAE